VLVAAVLTLVITAAEQFTAFQVLSATFLIFTASTLVVLLVEIRRRSDRTENILAIFDRLAGSGSGSSAFKEVGRHLGSVLDNYPDQPEIAIAWQTAMHRCADNLDQLAQGHLVTRTSDQTYKLAFLDRGLTLKATSLLRTNMDFWVSSDGEEYWNEQVRALHEGHAIQRVFIYAEEDAAVEELIRRHADAGVETYKVHESRLSADDRVDITLWGSEAVFYKHFQQRPVGLGQWYDRFSFRTRDVAETTAQYTRILKAATPVLPTA